MNIFSEILSSPTPSVVPVSSSNVDSKLSAVSSAIEDAKSTLDVHFEEMFIKFHQHPKEIRNLANDIADLTAQSIDLEAQMETVVADTLPKAFSTLHHQKQLLDENSRALVLFDTILEIHKRLNNMHDLVKSNRFVDCMKTVAEVEGSVGSIEEEYTPLIGKLADRLNTQKHQLVEKLEQFASNFIACSSKGDYYVIKIHQDIDALSDVLNAFYMHDPEIPVLRDLSDFLVTHIFDCILKHSCKIVESAENAAFNVLVVTKTNGPLETKSVLDNIQHVLQFLTTCMKDLHFTVDNIPVLTVVTTPLANVFIENIINECLETAIPSTVADFLHSSDLLKAIEELHKCVEAAHIQDKRLLDFVNTFEEKFVKKKCDWFVNESKTLMKKDLHDILEVDVCFEGNATTTTTTTTTKVAVSKHIPLLFTSMISIFEECQLLSEESSRHRFVDLIADTVKMYGTFVPVYHGKMLATIPQQVAIFYNNCMHLGGEVNKYFEMAFAECAALQTVGQSELNRCVANCVQQMEERINETGLPWRATLDTVDPTIERNIRQCLRQLELLHSSWMKILPATVYHKIVGDLLDTLCSKIINSVVHLEDISSTAAEQLVQLLNTTVVARGPKVIADANQVRLYVESWCKLNELVFILGAGLADINERWSDGKGSLAYYFAPNELKQLIRALFQNTDKRATFLAKIRS